MTWETGNRLCTPQPQLWGTACSESVWVPGDQAGLAGESRAWALRGHFSTLQKSGHSLGLLHNHFPSLNKSRVVKNNRQPSHKPVLTHCSIMRPFKLHHLSLLQSMYVLTTWAFLNRLCTTLAPMPSAVPKLAILKLKCLCLHEIKPLWTTLCSH